MGILQSLYRSSGPEDPRDAIRMSYNEHRFRSSLPQGTSPHRAGLYGALRARYLARGQSVSEMTLWAELAPFLLMAEGTGCEALAEYVIYQEDPAQANVSWLTKILSASLRPSIHSQDSSRTMLSLAMMKNLLWCSLLEADIKYLLERQVKDLRHVLGDSTLPPPQK